jgi:hypothetical protein
LSCPAGTPKQLPEGYQGLLLKPCGAGAKPGSSSSDTQQRSWQATGSFQQVTVWNHDTVPAASDWHMRCIDFLALADKVGARNQPRWQPAKSPYNRPDNSQQLLACRATCVVPHLRRRNTCLRVFADALAKTWWWCWPPAGGVLLLPMLTYCCCCCCLPVCSAGACSHRAITSGAGAAAHAAEAVAAACGAANMAAAAAAQGQHRGR